MRLEDLTLWITYNSCNNLQFLYLRQPLGLTPIATTIPEGADTYLSNRNSHYSKLPHDLYSLSQLRANFHEMG